MLEPLQQQKPPYTKKSSCKQGDLELFKWTSSQALNWSLLLFERWCLEPITFFAPKWPTIGLASLVITPGVNLSDQMNKVNKEIKVWTCNVRVLHLSQTYLADDMWTWERNFFGQFVKPQWPNGLNNIDIRNTCLDGCFHYIDLHVFIIIDRNRNCEQGAYFCAWKQSLLAISILIADDCWTWGPLLNSIWFASIKWSGVQVGLNSNFGGFVPWGFWRVELFAFASWQQKVAIGPSTWKHMWYSGNTYLGFKLSALFFCACSGSQVMIMSRNVGFSWLHRVNVTTGSPEFFSTGNASINRKIGRVVLELLW